MNTNWEDFLYLAQLNQGFALKTCLEHWRTNQRTNGSIIWQINDSWPVTSWAIIDYELKPKLAYHFVKNIFAQQIASFIKKGNRIELHVLNQSMKNFLGVLNVNVLDTSSGVIVEKITKIISIKANAKTIIDNKLFAIFEKNKNLIAVSSLLDRKGSLINTNYYKEQPWKYVKTAKAKISLRISGKGLNKHIIIKSDKPAYFVDLYCKGIEFDKRGVNILQGEEVLVNMSGPKLNSLKTKDIKIFSLNNYL